MYDAITIGSALIDTFIHSDHFSLNTSEEGVLLCQKFGDKIEVSSYDDRTGGGGGNVAVGLARLGFRVAAVAELGKDVLAQLVMDELHSEVVATNFLVAERKEQTGGSVILLAEGGGRTVLVHRGASSYLDPHDLPESALSQTRWVHLSSIAGRLSTLRKLFQIIEAENYRRSQELQAQSHRQVELISLSWNPGSAELKLLAEGLLPVVDIPLTMLVVNAQEWEMLGIVQSQLEEQVPIIIVTDGERGGVHHQPELGWQRFRALPGKSVDDTGAGDAFAAGCVAGQLRGRSVAESVRWGVWNAHSVIQKIGAKPGLLTVEQLSAKQHEQLESFSKAVSNTTTTL